DLLGVLGLVVLVAFNGLFVAAEYALVSVRRTRVDQRADEGFGPARRVQRILGKLDLYIAAVQLGVSMASLGIGFVAEPSIQHLVSPALVAANLSPRSIEAISLAIAFILSTVLHILFGELVPKSIALQRAEQAAFSLSGPLVAFTAIFQWVVRGLTALSVAILKLLGLKAVAGHHTPHSEEEIRAIVSASSQEGVLEDEEKELLYNVFDLSDTPTRAIMTPRVDMVVIPEEANLSDLLDLFREHGYSRVPVYRATRDQIVGIAHAADVLSHLENLRGVNVGAIVRPTYYAPEGMKVIDLFRALKAKKTHMAIVVDEFGGTSGLVTFEDVLEELVGEIYDETDEEEAALVQRLSEGVYLLDAATPIDDVEEALGVSLAGEDDENDFDTLSGFINQRFGYIPAVGEGMDVGGWRLQVEKADERRVSKVRASRVHGPAADAPSGATGTVAP
ncbi:MAG TPA: hemolysin family protein, partial [Deinococcales bacterium]|nr:hemolysin family protein [Deinococcales bacterium]